MIYRGNLIESQQDGQVAERIVAEAIEAQRPDWHIIHSRWSVHDNGRQYDEGEADIIVVIPNRGFVVLEVKSHKFHRVVNGTWQFSGDGAIWTAHKKEPWRQASDVQWRWRKEFERASIGGDCGIPSGFGVCFPCAECRVNYVAGGRRALLNEGYLDFTIVKSDLPEISDLIEQFLVKWARGRTCNTDGVLARLIPTGVEFVPPTRDHRTYVANELIKLTREQDRAVRGFMANAGKGAAIIGGAGSGKSVIARQVACDAAKRGKHVWLLCYNALLAEDNEAAVSRFGVKCATFHGFARRMVDQYGAAAGVHWPRIADEHFLANGADDLLMNLIRRGNTDRVDLLVIDEFQDLSFSQAGTLLKLQAADRVIFCDPRQNLFGPQGAGELNIPAGFARYELQLNVRNVREVATCVQAVGAGEMRPDSLRYCPPIAAWPEITATVVGNAAVKELRYRLEQWFGVSQQLPPQEVAVLCVDSAARDALIAAVGAVGRYRPVRKLADWRAGDGFLIETIGRFKGLDAGAVVVFGVPAPQSTGTAFTVADAYVGLSRPKFELCVIPADPGAKSWFENLVEQARRTSDASVDGALPEAVS